MKKFMALLLGVVAAVSITACSTPAEKEKKAVAPDHTQKVEAVEKTKEKAENPKDYDPATYWEGHEQDLIYGGKFVMKCSEIVEGMNYTMNVVCEVDSEDQYIYLHLYGDDAWDLKLSGNESSIYLITEDIIYACEVDSGMATEATGVNSNLDVENMEYLRSEDGFDIYNLPVEEGEPEMLLYVDHVTKMSTMVTQDGLEFYLEPLEEHSFDFSTVENPVLLSENEFFSQVMGQLLSDHE